MNIKLVDSLAQIINTLTSEEKKVLQTKINLVTTNNNLEIEDQSWHNFIENTYGSIQDESFVRQPQGYITQRESIE